MYKLAVVIPNYGRQKELIRLLKELINQITDGGFEELVEICISDDCSPVDPTEAVSKIISENSNVSLSYSRKQNNEGMDSNFLSAVLMAHAEYCWIMGNDDMPEDKGIETAVRLLEVNKDADFVLTSFDVFSESGQYRLTTQPLTYDIDVCFDTRDVEECKKYVMSVAHSSGIFAFLSNVIFKRNIWVERSIQFNDKIGSIFIQMYINIDAVIKGSLIYYSNNKIVKNYSDDETNGSVDRICSILFGLDGVIDFFFKGEEKFHLKRILTDAYISGVAWNLPNDDIRKKTLKRIESKKNDIYKKYFLERDSVASTLDGKEVVIYGAGNYGRITLDALRDENIRVVAIADSDRNKVGAEFEKYVIVSVDDMMNICKESDRYIAVSSNFYLCEMVQLLEDNGIDNIVVVA